MLAVLAPVLVCGDGEEVDEVPGRLGSAAVGILEAMG
jgi:hypothetical protein